MASSTTVATLINEVHRKLTTVYKEEVDVINEGAAWATADTSLTLTYASTSLGDGDLIEVESELCLVVDASANPITVIRGYMGTTAVQHDDGSLVRISPRFPRIDIRGALKQSINSYKNLFWVDHTTVNATPHESDNRGFLIGGIPSDFKQILSIHYMHDSGAIVRVKDAWVTRNYGGGEQTYLNLQRDFYSPLPTAAFNVDVVFSMPFVTSTFEETTNIESQVKMPESMHDLPVLGALWRLISAEEGASASPSPQGLFRRREEVPPGYALQVGQGYKQMHDMRLNDEEYKLGERYG